jgi:hypothetical protein
MTQLGVLLKTREELNGLIGWKSELLVQLGAARVVCLFELEPKSPEEKKIELELKSP